MLDPQNIFSFPEPERLPSGGFRLRWTVPINLPYFAGHFPNNPVMPAVAILDASQEFLKSCGLAVDARKMTLKKAKFLALVGPGMDLELQAEPLNSQWLVRWSNPNAWQGSHFQSVCEVSFLL